MKKRGISPLIATVLLIGFVVALAALIMLWGGRFVREKAEKEGALSEKQLECENVEIDVASVDVRGRGSTISIENKKNKQVDGFIFRAIKKDGSSETIQKIEKLESLSVAEIDIEFVFDKLEVIPALRPEGRGAPLVPCSSKSVVYNVR